MRVPARNDLVLLYRVFGLREFSIGFDDNTLLGGTRVTVNASDSIEIVCRCAVDPGHAAVVGGQLAILFVPSFPTGRLCGLFPHRVRGFELLLQPTDFLRQRLIVRGLGL
ncbi:hypothetical protein [Mycobacterium sp. SMC-2]|uniref:hypothetical protein n=1 Tax=Mycobacterium sp. SMC-2 TaxID=2857058 RepID=UPI0021B24673|nr:hypothetical protein [Mycobacterium sp. SMC-2]